MFDILQDVGKLCRVWTCFGIFCHKVISCFSLFGGKVLGLLLNFKSRCVHVIVVMWGFIGGLFEKLCVFVGLFLCGVS